MGRPLNPAYTRYHPKWHRRRIPIFWWLRKLAYTKFIARELTSVAVAYSALLLLIQIWALGQGEAAYTRFLGWLRSPPLAALNTVILFALLFHTVTWLNLAPQALVVRVAGRRVPDRLILAGHYLAWALATGFVLWILFVR